jgi:putative ABC transport system ATP-binding protein
MASGEPVLSGTGLAARVQASSGVRDVFSGIALELYAGEVVDLVGPSGSGKTTLLGVLARMQPFAEGRLMLCGTDAREIPVCTWRKRVALLPQQAAFAEGDVRLNLCLPFNLKVHAGDPRPKDQELRALLDDAGLSDIELDRDVARLSGGQRARVALCRTLLTHPRVLLLDEVDAALDTGSVEIIGALVESYVKGEQAACLRVRHREPDAHTTRRLVLEEGRLAKGDDV